ncbi:site-specific integrase [Dyadobacter sp. CY327]|uniref:tyrosine-type recombinase/integrase n=1 Tax=Dyadobacter sp. CY327 TaxID=2907301 RepID=UPI001F1C8756|nr:site-specific integrase [Dyadobacter sp. CY327]MCE7071976.1 site-specific integrase [Dyadobacter sp. CY327]
MKTASASIFFDKRRMKEGLFSVKISVYFNEKQKLVPTGFMLPAKDVDFLKKNKFGLSGRVKDEDQRNLWNMIYGNEYFDPLSESLKQSPLDKVQRIIATLDDKFTFESFQAKLDFNEPSKKQVHTDMLAALQQRIAELSDLEKHSREKIFIAAHGSLARFAVHAGLTSSSKPMVPFSIVTTDFLKSYEKYMLEKGGTHRHRKTAKPVSMTTIAYYTNCFSEVLRRAVDQGVITQQEFPIGGKGYKIPKGRKPKKALASDVIIKLMTYESKKSNRMFGRDMWLFSYLCNGVNFADICRMKWESVNEDKDRIIFIRNKTKDTKDEKGTKVLIRVLPEAKAILERWSVPSDDKNDYVFGFLTNQMSEREKLYTIIKTINRVNTNMAAIAKDLNIKDDLTTYAARHSFATTLARAEVPLSFISQSLGHSSLATTQGYLGSFEDVDAHRYMAGLIPSHKSD